VATKKPAKIKPDMTNPLTGKAPNTFTQSQGRELPKPTNVQPFVARRMEDPSGAKTQGGNPQLVPDVKKSGSERARLRKAHVEATKPGGVVDAQVGYRKPEGMDQRSFGWITGAHHMFPNVAGEMGTPAINEPHAPSRSVTTQRRAEDLSGPEYKKGQAVLAHYGHDARNPTASLKDTVERQTNRVISEHIRAGVEESASQLFYGGRVNTEIPDADLNMKHHEGVRAANQALTNYSAKIATHPAMEQHMPGSSHMQKMRAATDMMAQAAADTSPNAKWRDTAAGTGAVKWPNLEQAHESVTAALEKRPAKFLTGRTPNEEKAAGRAGEMLDKGNFDTHAYGDPSSAPKTIAFRGALSDRDHPDAYTVADVHHASVLAPGLSTSKSRMYDRVSGQDDIKNQRVRIHGDQPDADTKGLVQRFKSTRGGGKTIPEAGLSRPEEMLDKGKPIVHALSDRAVREVATATGLSRSVNHSDNVHPLQAALWGSQQVQRPDVNVSHADQYPVVRNWGSEGHATLTDQGKHLFGASPANLSPQFRANPNTIGINKKGTDDHVPGRVKPYDV
jgi:hypothetical protein